MWIMPEKDIILLNEMISSERTSHLWKSGIPSSTGNSTVYLPVFFSQKMQSKDMSLHFNNIFNVWTAKRHSHIYVNQTRTKEQHMLYSKADNRIQDTIPLRLYTDVGNKMFYSKADNKIQDTVPLRLYTEVGNRIWREMRQQNKKHG